MRLSNGKEFFAKTVISNATRWDTFGNSNISSIGTFKRGKTSSFSFINLLFFECTGKLLKEKELPEEEKNFQKNYVKAPSFLSIHMGVKASVLPAGTDCHHFVLEVCVVFTGNAILLRV